MRRSIKLNEGWSFALEGDKPQRVDIPHTWNGTDGQDGGDNYLRTTARYKRSFVIDDLAEGERCFLEFGGVNSECDVIVATQRVAHHDGGYSTFRAEITDLLLPTNDLEVVVTNEPNDTVYPQKADFTFYGGIYRDVWLRIVPKNHFAFMPMGAPPLKLTTTVEDGMGVLLVEGQVVGSGEAEVAVWAGERLVAVGKLGKPITIPHIRLWDGLNDPFLYKVTATLSIGGQVVDEVSGMTGFRSFHIDPEEGFFLNGKPYPLRGVCRHQDRPKKGNAISVADHDEDMALIREVGANTIRLAHYQHDQYFYDLCDRVGMIVWAEIPYISKHMPNANDNAESQMLELVRQNIHHPSIVCWGISNEITIAKISSDTVACHQRLHELCHEEDPNRLTVVACYMAIFKGNPTAHVSDLVSYNLYFGWYLPFTSLAGWKLDGWRKKYPHIPIGLSEYGAEGMPNLHSSKPKRLDNTEEYQCIYHEQMLQVIEDRPYLWATHLWNMFDFAADARNQGGEPGMNHKGLVTFDRKTRKDAFYLYKAHWSKERFVHITGKRFVNRTDKQVTVKVYSNCDRVELYANGTLVEAQTGKHVFEFVVPMVDILELEAKSGHLSDTAQFRRVLTPDPSYKLQKGGTNTSWEK